VKFVRYLLRNGLRYSIEEFFLRFKIWDLSIVPTGNLSAGSSISDNSDYVGIVNAATHNDEIFTKFRSNRQYRLILEHVTHKLGDRYLSELGNSGFKTNETLKLVENIDKMGTPIRYRFKQLGKASPTTIRYMFVHNELVRHFGSMDGFKVIEIGGGFGGQAAVSKTINSTLDWNIYDLPIVSKLQQKFLERCGIKSVSFHSGLQIEESNGNLLISNYALSEVSRDLQLEYMNKVVLNCPRGYMAWNLLSEIETGGLSVSEVLDIIPGSSAVAEVPLSHTGNVVITWGTVL
jgi:hypothetical protein